MVLALIYNTGIINKKKSVSNTDWLSFFAIKD
jgi:hypothetical protein